MTEPVGIKEALGSYFDPYNESGLEARWQRTLRELNIPFKQQVKLKRQKRRLDFVIDKTLNIELDGLMYHKYEEDVKRDIQVAAAGFKIVRINDEICYRYTYECIAWIVRCLLPHMDNERIKSYRKAEGDYNVTLRVFNPIGRYYWTCFV